jgi:hypothetical protein
LTAQHFCLLDQLDLARALDIQSLAQAPVANQVVVLSLD